MCTIEKSAAERAGNATRIALRWLGADGERREIDRAAGIERREIDPDAGRLLAGEVEGAGFGTRLHALDDIDADGFADIVVGEDTSRTALERFRTVAEPGHRPVAFEIRRDGEVLDVRHGRSFLDAGDTRSASTSAAEVTTRAR